MRENPFIYQKIILKNFYNKNGTIDTMTLDGYYRKLW